MNIRLALYELGRTHRLPRDQLSALFKLAQLDLEPAGVRERFWHATGLLAASLGGFGLILWVAANWSVLSRTGQFAALQIWIVLTALLMWRKVTLRVPAGMLCFFGIGALFGYFGQTYQTGADPWQLFALWALLGFPLCLVARSEVLWLSWTLVACCAINLWANAYTGYRWENSAADLPVQVISWIMGALLAAMFGRPMQRWIGVKRWSQNLASIVLAISLTLTALSGVLSDGVTASPYIVGLILAGLAACVLMQSRWFHIVGLSLAVFCIDILLSAGWIRLVFPRSGNNIIGALLLSGLGAAVILAASVAGLVRRQRHVRGARSEGVSA